MEAAARVWHNVILKKRELHAMMRCKCEKLRKTLEILRTGKPSVAQLREITKGHKAPSLGRAGYIMNEIPSQSDVAHILEETPQTLFLTVSRQACALLNGFAVEALFGASHPVAMVPSGPESNVQNYEKGKKVRDEPAEIPIYVGMKVILTKNLNKAVGFVNGMGAQVLGMDRGNIIVKTDQGRRLAIHPWTSEEKVVRFPVRMGYASALHKVQGGDVSTHPFVPRCAKHASGCLRCTEPGPKGRRLAICRQSGRAPLHPSEVSLSVTYTIVEDRDRASTWPSWV